MEGKITVDEVNDFIKNFKLKNKAIKNNSQLYKKEGTSANQKESVKTNEIDNDAEKKDKPIAKINTKPNIEQMTQKVTEKDNEDVQDLFSKRDNGGEDVDDIFSIQKESVEKAKLIKETAERIKVISLKKEHPTVISPLKDNILQPLTNYDLANGYTNEITHNPIESIGLKAQINIASSNHKPIQISSNVKSDLLSQNNNGTIQDNNLTKQQKSQIAQIKQPTVAVVHKNPFDDDNQTDDIQDFFNKEEKEFQIIESISLKNKKSQIIENPNSPIKFPLERKQLKEPNNQLFQQQSEIITEEINPDLQLIEQQSLFEPPIKQKTNFYDNDYNKSIKEPKEIKPYFKPSKIPIMNKTKNPYQSPMHIIHPENATTTITTINSSMKNIYDNFSNEFKAKEEIFQPIIFNQEIEQLDTDNNQPPILNPQFRTNSIEKDPYQAIDGNPFQIDNDQHVSLSSSSSLGTRLINGQIIKSIDSKIIVLSLSELSKNNKENNYFPISYSEQFNFENSINYLEAIQSSNNKSNIMTTLAVYCELMLLKNKMKLQSCNIFAKDNNDIRQEMIFIINQSFLSNDFYSFDIINSNNNTNKVDVSSMLLSSYDQFKDSLLNHNNLASFILLSIISTKEELNNSMITMFDKGLIKKNSYWYLLLMIKSGQIDKLLQEDSALVFNHFKNVILILLENYESIINPHKVIDIIIKSNNEHLTYLHYIILFFLQNSFIIENESLHGKLITQFLNVPTLKKIIISDIFNYICYCLNQNLNKIIAKSSILIKFKYTLIKRYNCDTNVSDLSEKINNNSSQFGSIGRNRYFKDYLMNDYIKNQDNEKSIRQHTEECKENSVNTTTSTLNNKKKNNEKSGGGLVSSLFSALGFGGNNDTNVSNNNNTDQGETRVLTKEEKASMTPEQLWKYEHPDEDDIYYDPVLKRYVLRGQIYDDQDEVFYKENQAKPVAPPPKNTKFKTNQLSNIIQDSQTQIQMQPETKTKIVNPFEAKGLMKQPKEQNRFQAPSLNNRYAVGYNP